MSYIIGVHDHFHNKWWRYSSIDKHDVTSLLDLKIDGGY